MSCSTSDMLMQYITATSHQATTREGTEKNVALEEVRLTSGGESSHVHEAGCSYASRSKQRRLCRVLLQHSCSPPTLAQDAEWSAITEQSHTYAPVSSSQTMHTSNLKNPQRCPSSGQCALRRIVKSATKSEQSRTCGAHFLTSRILA